MQMSAQQKLAKRFAAMKKNGCVDVRFSLVEDLTDATPESVCAEVENMYVALEQGHCRPLNFNDSRRAA